MSAIGLHKCAFFPKLCQLLHRNDFILEMLFDVIWVLELLQEVYALSFRFALHWSVYAHIAGWGVILLIEQVQQTILPRVLLRLILLIMRHEVAQFPAIRHHSFLLVIHCDFEVLLPEEWRLYEIKPLPFCEFQIIVVTEHGLIMLLVIFVFYAASDLLIVMYLQSAFHLLQDWWCLARLWSHLLSSWAALHGLEASMARLRCVHSTFFDDWRFLECPFVRIRASTTLQISWLFVEVLQSLLIDLRQGWGSEVSGLMRVLCLSKLSRISQALKIYLWSRVFRVHFVLIIQKLQDLAGIIVLFIEL